MCSSALRGMQFALALAAVAAPASPAFAQRGDGLDGPRNAVIVAARAYDAARAAARADSARRAQLPLVRTLAGLEVRADTTRVPAGFIHAMDTAFAAARAEARAFFGNAVDTLLRGIFVSVVPRVSFSKEGAPIIDSSVVEFRTSSGINSTLSNEGTNPPDVDGLTGHFRGWYGWSAGLRVPQTLRRWGGTEVAIIPREVGALRTTYVRLATFSTKTSRACIDGSLFACRTALAIVPNADTIGAWSDAAERRARVGREFWRYSRRRYLPPARTDELASCVDKGEDYACRSVIVRLGVTSPTTGDARKAMLRRAVVRGGPEGYQRLVASQSTDVAELLETAAGVPLDSLVAEWRAAVLATRTPSPMPNGIEFTATLVLGALIVGFSVRRRP